MKEENNKEQMMDDVRGGSAMDQHLSNMSGKNNNLDDSVDPEKAEIDYGLSAVAQNPKKSMITMGIMVVVIGALAYYFLFSGGSKNKDKSGVNNITIPASATSNVTTSDVPVPTIPNSQVAPPPPAPSAPSNNDTSNSTSTPPAPPPSDKQESTVAPPQPAAPTFQQQALEQQQQMEALQKKQALAKREKERVTSNIMVKSGTSDASGGGKDANNSAASMLASNGKFIPQQTSATQQQITKVGNMSSLIAQGKVIDAVLESSIVSTYPGPVRALVTRDVYSEKGENVLIPKGSRLIGSFSTGFQAGKSRISIIWNRLIMPDGYDIAVASPSVGPEGITGVEGELHTEFLKTLTNAALVSAINISFAKAAQSITNTKPTQTTTTSDNTTGNTTTTSVNDPTTNAINSSVSNLGNTLQNYVNQNFVAQPFISIEHGTRVRVFVNKDILFPGNRINGVNIVQ